MTNEWIEIDEKELQYHINQYENPKAYSIRLLEQFSELGLQNSKKILDLGCGAGAVANYFATAHPQIKFVGIDLSQNYINIANRLKKENSSFECLSLEDLNENHSDADGVFCFQTLSWMPDYSAFLKMLAYIKPDWALVTSLFYNGPVDAFTKIYDYSRSMGDVKFRRSNYNTYSLMKFNKKLNKIGFHIELADPFEFPYDLPKPNGGEMCTYTEKMEDGKRLQISGPLLMNWHTLLIKKINIVLVICVTKLTSISSLIIDNVIIA